VLSAQALASTYGADGTLVGVIAFAPQWPTRLNSLGYVDPLNNPIELSIQTGTSEQVVTVMRTCAYFYNEVGASDADDGFPTSNQAGFDSAINAECETPLAGYLASMAPEVGDIFDPTLHTTLLACINGDGGAGCVDPGLGYYKYLTDNFVTSDPSGARVLYVQGLDDVITPPASEAACNLAKLAADGVTAQVCVDSAAQHSTVVDRNMDFALSWGQAVLGGSSLPTCSAAGMPTCTP
jgi:hypothetical protein